MSEDIKLWASQMETENIEEEEHLANKPVSVARSKKPSFNRGDPNDPQLIQTTTSGKNKYGELLYKQWKENKNSRELTKQEYNQTHNFKYKEESPIDLKVKVPTQGIQLVSNKPKITQSARQQKLREIETQITGSIKDDASLSGGRNITENLGRGPQTERRVGSSDAQIIENTVFNRLFARSKYIQSLKIAKKKELEQKRVEKEMEQCKFAPEVNSNSIILAQQTLPRNEKIETRQKRAEIIQKNTDLEIKYQASAPKTNKFSEELAFSKLEKDLEQAMKAVNCLHSGKMSFEELGLFLNYIGIFKILFNPAYSITLNQQGEFVANRAIIVNHIQTYNKLDQRKHIERNFLLNLWWMLSQQKYAEYVNRSIVLELFKMIYDPNIISNEEMVKVVTKLLETAFAIINESKSDVEQKIETYIASEDRGNDQWNINEFLSEFKRLNDTKQTGLKSNFVKANKLVKQTQAEFNFKPKIDEKSRKLADRQMNKIKQQIKEGSPIEEQRFSMNAGKIISVRAKENYPDLGANTFENEKYYTEPNYQEYQSVRSEQHLLGISKQIAHPGASDDNQIIPKRYQLLYQKHFQTQAKIENIKKEKLEKEISKYNFQPVINKRTDRIVGDRIGTCERKHIWDQKLKSKELPVGYKSKLEKELEECTFQPTLVAKKKENKVDMNTPVAGYQSTVDRFRNAAISKAKQNLDKERMGKSTVKYEKNKHLPMKPFSFENRVKVDKEPLVYLDVNIGKGKSGRIAIYREDKPETLATNFCRIHTLNEGIKQTLEGLIQAQMEKYFVPDNLRQFSVDE